MSINVKFCVYLKCEMKTTKSTSKMDVLIKGENKDMREKEKKTREKTIE